MTIEHRVNPSEMDEHGSADALLFEEIAQLETFFDEKYYLAENPDVAQAGLDPLEHFCRYGWQENRDPAPFFSTSFYREDNPDIEAAGINPFWHFVVAGELEGRLGRPPEGQYKISPEDSQASPGDAAFKELMNAIRARFDEKYYLAENPDVAQAGIDPLEHFCQNGWQENRDPSPFFSTSFYREDNPDIEAAGINPFWHFVVAGELEGRIARHPGGYRVEQLLHTTPLETTVEGWLRKGDQPGALLNRLAIVEKLTTATINGRDHLLLSAGHDHYRQISGGVQLCIHQEERLAADYGAVYLNLHPWQPLPRLLHQADETDPIMRLLLDGEEIGLCRISELIKAVQKMNTTFASIRLIIHHMLGHLPERLTELVKATGRRECWLWLHDFFTVCPSFSLQRNNVSYCGAPDQNSNACTLCLFGRERRSHSERMAHFFDTIRVHTLAPSESTRTIWEATSNLTPASMQVLPHMQLEWCPRTTEARTDPDKITLAFLGTPAPHKGWNVFQSLTARLDNKKYRFVLFSSANPPLSNVVHVPTHVTADDPDAMIRNVEKYQVDLVLHWATWPETFSLSTYEALSGGAYVLTNPISGNVAASVLRLDRGAVLDGADALVQFFESGRAQQMVDRGRAERRKYQVESSLSHMSLQLFDDLKYTVKRPIK